MLLTLAPFAGGLDLGFLAPGAELAGMGRILYPRLEPLDAAWFSLIVWLLGIGAAFWPARAAAKASPVAAMGQL
jgi:ABC-type lipoprotein release transport system permease subunit